MPETLGEIINDFIQAHVALFYPREQTIEQVEKDMNEMLLEGLKVVNVTRVPHDGPTCIYDGTVVHDA